MIRAVLFDLDGTLTDTLADIACAMNRALRLNGLPEWPVESYKRLVGNGAKTLSVRCVRDRQELQAQVLTDYQAYYETHTLVETRPYDGIVPMLHALAERGVLLAVFSNKPDADTKRVVRHFFLDVPWVQVRGQVVGVPVKPDPAGALMIAREMQVQPDEVLYLGDTDVDMHCARAAGMIPVGAAWGFRTVQELQNSGASFIAKSPLDVLNWVEM